VWKFAPDLSQKLGVSQHLLLPTVLSKLTKRFSVVNSIEMQQTAAATTTPPAAAAVAIGAPNLPTDLLPPRLHAAEEVTLQLPNLPPLPPPLPHAHPVAAVDCV